MGLGEEGQLGHGDCNKSATLQRVDGLPPCSMVSTGCHFTLCLTTEGQVFSFGMNESGQLGQGHLNNLNKPHQVKGMPPIRSLQCGQDFAFCVDIYSSVWVFGCNDEGQLGLGHNGNVSTPTCLEKISARQVACGLDHSMVLTTEGQLLATGAGSQGELGLGVFVTSSNYLQSVPLPCEVASVHCGSNITAIVATDNTVYTTGDDRYGQMGRGQRRHEQQEEFIQVPGVVASQLACGLDFFVAIDMENQLWGWGMSRHLELGKRSGEPVWSPVIIHENASVVLTGINQVIVLTTNGEVEVCGHNVVHQLSGNRIRALPWTTATSIKADMVQIPPKITKHHKSAQST